MKMIKIRALLFVFLVYNIVYSQKKASVLKDDKLTLSMNIHSMEVFLK